MKKSLTLFLAVLFTGFFPGTLHATNSDAFLLNRVTRTVAQTRMRNKKTNPQVTNKIASQYRATLLDRFLRYVTYNSQSQEDVQITPSQIETAQKLYAEINQMGFDKNVSIELSEHYYIFVNIPSNQKQDALTLGFSAHYDVTPDVPAENVTAQVIKKYNGEPIALKNDQVLDPASERDAYLKTQIGKTVVTSDGTTNLGADDKAGLSIIMTLLDTLAHHPEIKHGPIQVVLAPNEDVGRAAEFIEEIPYRPEIAFDFDGGSNGEIMVANFNARQTFITVEGRPGHQSAAATNGYRNAWTPACEMGASICTETLVPNNSTGDQGYVELHHMFYEKGNVSTALLDIRQRGYDSNEMDTWEAYADTVAQEVAEKYGVKISRRTIVNYCNVAEVCHPKTREVTERACEAAGVTPNCVSVRAGTTAAMFVTKGLVGAYTVFTGQNNEHAVTEWLSEDDMFKSYLVALNLVQKVAQQNK